MITQLIIHTMLSHVLTRRIINSWNPLFVDTKRQCDESQFLFCILTLITQIIMFWSSRSPDSFIVFIVYI